MGGNIRNQQKHTFSPLLLSSFFFIEDKLGKGKYGTGVLLRNPRNSISKGELMEEGAF